MKKIVRSNKFFISLLSLSMISLGMLSESVVRSVLAEEKKGECALEVTDQMEEGDTGANLSYTTLIAVVNLDEGVLVHGRREYYGHKLISFPNEHFEMCKLQDAEQGLKSGTYGACIVLPASFSRSIESINRDPQRAVLSYTINNNNAPSALTGVVGDVHTFLSL